MSGHFNVLSLDISGENNTIQVGQRNFIICSDAPVDVGPDSDDGDDDEGEWTQVSQRQGQPGVPQVPNAVHSTPDLDISGSGHLVQTGKTCLQMPMDADPNQVSQIAAVRLPTGDETFSPRVRIRGQNHDIQHGDVCIKVSSPPVPGQPPSPLSQASASANGAIPSAEPTTKGVEEEGSGDSDWEQSQHVQHNVHLRPPPLSSLQADGRGEETDLKTTSAPQPSLPHQESATGAQGQGDNPTKWQLLAAEERAIGGAEPQIPAKIVGDRAEQPDVAVPALGQQRVIDLKGNITCLSGRAVPTEDEISNLTSPEPIVFDSRSQPTSNTVFNTTSISSITAQVESTSSRPELSPAGDDDISNVSLDSTLKAAAAEPVDKSPSLSQSQGSGRSTGSLSTRTLTSSGINQRGERARSVDPQPSRDDEISNDSHSDVDVESSVKEADVFTSAVASKTSASLKESQQDWTTRGELDDGGSRKGEKIRSPVPVEPTMAKKSSYDRSHSLDSQLTLGVGLAEHHLGSFYLSQTAAAAAELRSGFTDNEISNDAIYEIQTDSVPEETKSPSPERQRKWQIAKPSIVTAVNASVLSSGSQHVEIREQSMEDMTQHQHWGHQLSDDDDIMEDEDYGIENPGTSKAMSRHSPPLLLGIDSHFRSLDVLKSQSALPSLSARHSLQASLVERVNRMEQVLDDVKWMKSEGQQNLESRMDRLEGMVEKVLHMMTTQKNNTPTTPNGSAPSSLQGVAHYGASGGEGPSHREQASER